MDREDRILAGFTARQVAVMAIVALLLYGGWMVTRDFLPVIAYLVVAVPVGVAAAALVVVRRDGVTLDRLVVAAIRQRLQPPRRVTTGAESTPVPDWLTDVAGGGDPETGALELPAHGVNEAGVVDLGSDGLVLLAACSTVNPAPLVSTQRSHGSWHHPVPPAAFTVPRHWSTTDDADACAVVEPGTPNRDRSSSPISQRTVTATVLPGRSEPSFVVTLRPRQLMPAWPRAAAAVVLASSPA
ncbi:hypothetical protein BJF85_20565 [Saccharomonospora sp. CUA-673]|nr:hypothetical protein BJF85_20565 [Saccharomonospora sp. CUA-673]